MASYRRRTAVVALLTATVLAVGYLGNIPGVWFSGRNQAEGPPHPTRWDPRMIDLVRFVEHTRGLRFHHPVTVAFLSDDDFRREVMDEDRSGSPDAASTDDRAAERDEEATARALGLLRGDVNLRDAGNTLSGEGILAYYDDVTQRVEVRGTDLTVGRRVTIVHELTHALQDQHFDLSRQDASDSDDRNAAFEAVVEGDAVRIENAYVASLGKADRDNYDQERKAGDAEYGARTAGVPDWLSATTDVPYTLGESFVSALAADGGRAAVDRAFRKPPRSEDQIMDATRYLAGGAARRVPSPAVPAGDRVIRAVLGPGGGSRAARGHGGARPEAFGAMQWLLVLAERIPAVDALTAVDGWGGDAVVVYEHDRRVCVKADFEGRRPADTDAMSAAFTRWAAAMPPGTARISRSGGAVELASCDPGAEAATVPAAGHVDDAMTLIDNRADALVTALGDGASRDQAACYAHAVVGTFTPAELAAADTTPGFDDKLGLLEKRCTGHPG